MSEHNTENPVNFETAMKELGCTPYYLTALKKRLGIKSRMFMLSIVRDFLRDNPGWTTTDVYPNHKKPGRGFYLRVKPEGKRWVVTMTSCPSVMAEDKSMEKAIALAGSMAQAELQSKAA